MIKAIGTAHRRDDFTPEQFIRHWNDAHAPLVAAIPGLRGYVVSEVVRRLRGPGLLEQRTTERGSL